MANFKHSFPLPVILTLLLATIQLFPVEANSVMPRHELDELNRAIAEADLYRQTINANLDSLKGVARKASSPDDRWRKTLDVADRYRLINSDSAIHYAESAYRIAEVTNNHKQSILSLLHLIDALSTAGIFTVAKSNYEVVSSWDIPVDLKRDFWETGGRLYDYMSEEMGEDSPYRAESQHLYKSLCDSLLNHIPESDPISRRMKIDKLFRSGNVVGARDSAENLLREFPKGTRNYSLTAVQLAFIYQHQGDEKNYAACLARSATSDIMACISDGMALPALANWLYDKDELEDAYRYVNFALQDASSSSSRLRTLAIAQLVPNIETAYRKKINSGRNQLLAGLIVVLILLSATVGLVFILIRQNKRAHYAKEKLSRLSKVQESYVGNFIALYSSYANRLDSVTKLVGRKLSSGQADELLKMVKAGKLDSNGEDEDFNKFFDKAFLDMYPNFVVNVNSLLRPDQQIVLKDEHELTPELRIYAFVKLGVDESVKIAQIMRYSVSTVYAYRNRMRNRAIDRDNFDKAISDVDR